MADILHWIHGSKFMRGGKEAVGGISFSALLSYALTPWSRVLLEKLTGSQIVKKLPAFYGTLRFITAFTKARHPSLSLARSIQTMPPSWISYSARCFILLQLPHWLVFTSPEHLSQAKTAMWLSHSCGRLEENILRLRRKPKRSKEIQKK